MQPRRDVAAILPLARLPVRSKKKDYWGAWHSVTQTVETFITRWQGQEGGQERANYALFLTELCDLLGLAHADPASATTEGNDYVF